MNPFSIAGTWRVDPDRRQDRGSGPVISYRLSPEEIEARYGKVVTQEKKSEEGEQISEGDCEVMRETKITKDQLIEECRRLGFGGEAYEAIAEKYGSNLKNISARVSQYKIKQLLNEEKQGCCK